MKLLLCWMIFLCPLFSQTQSKRLRVGDTVPDILFKQFVVNKTPQNRLSTLKKKLTILDLWAGYCTSCMHTFPLLDSIAAANPELRVLLVSIYKADNAVNTQRLFSQLRSLDGGKLRLPVIVGDTIVNHYFQPASLPYYVWLDEKLKVLAITGPEDVTGENVRKVLHDEPVAFGQKDVMENLDLEKPMYGDGNIGGEASIIGRSTLGRFIPGAISTSRYWPDFQNPGRMLYLNFPLSYLFMEACLFWDRPEFIHYPAGDTVANGTGKTQEWLTAHTYCYELITAPIPRDAARKLMQADLERWFGLAARVDTILTSCFLLKADTALLEKFRSRRQDNSIVLDSTGMYKMNGYQLDKLAALLGEHLPLKVLDESGYAGFTDLEWDGSPDPAKTNKILAKYGLRVVKGERLLPALIIYKTSN